MEVVLASYMVDNCLFVEKIMHSLYPLKQLYQRKTLMRSLLMLEVQGHLGKLRMLRSTRVKFDGNHLVMVLAHQVNYLYNLLIKDSFDPLGTRRIPALIVGVFVYI